jgi:peptidoglycan hydrolase-like protein with peptidoglycan-binding domain
MRTIVSAISALVVSTSFAAAETPQTSPGTAAPSAQSGSSEPAVPAHMSATAKKIHAMSRRRTEEIQTALNKDGAKLAVDGIYGPKTRAALAEFQKQNGLKVTGHVDPATLHKLQPQHLS